MRVSHQTEFDTSVLQYLRSCGHETRDTGGAGSVVGAVATMSNGDIMAKADYRKSGGVAGTNDSQNIGQHWSLIILIISIFASEYPISK